MNPSAQEPATFFSSSIDPLKKLLQKLEHLDDILKQYYAICGDVIGELLDDGSDAPFIDTEYDIADRIDAINHVIYYGGTRGSEFYNLYRDLFVKHNQTYNLKQFRLPILLDAVDDLINRVQRQFAACQSLGRGTTSLQQRFKSRYYAPGSGRGAQRTQQHYQTLKFE
jgi:hypothetical protein